MFCPNCGAQNADNATFCGNCGATFQQQAPVAPVAPAPGYIPAPVYGAPASVPGKGLGIASMVLGILSLVLFCFLYVSIPCALIGVALGGVGLKKAKDVGAKNGMAVAGLVCSIIALGVCVVYWIMVAAAVAEANAFLNSLY